jgi:hypothetical protein
MSFEKGKAQSLEAALEERRGRKPKPCKPLEFNAEFEPLELGSISGRTVSEV